jgi:uncharacterized protein YhhL (DUF1145 family)
MRIGSGRVFGLTYLVVWSAALAALLYFASDVHRYVSIGLAILLFAVAPDIATLKNLLSGREDDPADSQ